MRFLPERFQPFSGFFQFVCGDRAAGNESPQQHVVLPQTEEKVMLRAAILWMMGVPLVVVILIWYFFF